MIGRTITIDKLLADAITEYIVATEAVQCALKGRAIKALKDSQVRWYDQSQKVAHLVVCALINIDGPERP
jgi:hypothetical protein